MALLDQTDKKVLYTLYNQARTPVSTLAKQAGLTREVFQYRMDKLQTQHIIIGFRAKIRMSFFLSWSVSRKGFRVGKNIKIF